MSPSEAQLDKLEILFRRTSSLPPLSSVSGELLKAINTDDPSIARLEHIITSDPALAAKLLRLANSASQGSNHQSASIKEAIMRVGLRSVRTLALSLLLPALVAKSANADGSRCVRHSLFTALLARYLFVRNGLESTSSWSKDEIFAAGLLHDLGYPLLAHVDNLVYERVRSYGKRAQTTVNSAFSKIYGKDLGKVAALACEAWQLPEIFATVMINLEEPWQFEKEFASISCVTYADYLANCAGVGIEDWQIAVYMEPEVNEAVGLAGDEVETAVSLVNEQVEDLLKLFRSGGSTKAAA